MASVVKMSRKISESRVVAGMRGSIGLGGPSLSKMHGAVPNELARRIDDVFAIGDGVRHSSSPVFSTQAGGKQASSLRGVERRSNPVRRLSAGLLRFARNDGSAIGDIVRH